MVLASHYVNLFDSLWTFEVLSFCMRLPLRVCSEGHSYPLYSITQLYVYAYMLLFLDLAVKISRQAKNVECNDQADELYIVMCMLLRAILLT